MHSGKQIGKPHLSINHSIFCLLGGGITSRACSDRTRMSAPQYGVVAVWAVPCCCRASERASGVHFSACEVATSLRCPYPSSWGPAYT